MRVPFIVLGLTAASGMALVMSSADAAPPPGGVYKCATALSTVSGTASTYKPLISSDASVPPLDPAKDCKSSIILAYDGNVPVLNNAYDIVRLAVDMCELWDGPYKRIDVSDPKDPTFNSLDYVTYQTNNVPSTFNTSPATADVSAQLGIPGTISAKIFGTTSNNSAVVSLVDVSGPSQTYDAPGPEFLYMAKSSGGGTQATLICAANAWFWQDVPTTLQNGAETPFGGEWGFSRYPVMHNVNSVTAGWGGGTSGLRSQANIEASCSAMNGGAQQERVVKIYGTYKGDEVTRPPQFNVSSCDSLERVCTNLEPSGYGRPSSCNPAGGQASGTASSILQTKAGQNSLCLTFGQTTRWSSYGEC